MEIIKIAITEDHALLRKTLAKNLRMHENFDVVIAAENGKDLLDQLLNFKTDVVLLDIQMPIMNGHDTLLEIRKLYPTLKVIMYSQLWDESIVDHYIKLGANSFVCKMSEFEDLIDAINQFRYANS